MAVPLALASCSFDGDYDDSPDTAGVKTVRLQITANDPAAVNDTRFSPPAGDIDPNSPEIGDEGEYINSLDIFIVSGDDVVAYAAHLDDNYLDAAAPGGDAANGNLRSYTSDAIPLTEGTQYTVYAFANMSETYSQAWDGIASIAKDGTLSKATLDGIVLDDPADNLDFANGDFIPMSATETITDLSSPIIEVSLDRLVSKIRLAIKKDASVNVTSLKISGWADKVPLMNNATVSDANYACEKVFENPTLTQGTDVYTMADFYVNESPAPHPFTVEVKTSEQGSPVYTATTARDNLPRNCIYPLTLNLNTLTLQLKAGFWFNVIGERVPLEVTNSDNVFVVNIPDGMEFYIDAEMQGDTDGNTFTYNWAVEGGEQDAFTLMQEDANGGYSNVTAINDNPHVAGKVAALNLSEGESGGQYTLDLGVTWGASSRSYKVKINHVYFDEADWYEQIMAAVNTATTAASYLQPETLNMVVNH